jgi:Mg-chelatase subunit ChlD
MSNTSKKITKIYNLIILDESGSMHGLEKMSVDGVNETIQTIKSAAEANPEQKQMFSFITFSGMRPNERPYRVHTLLSEISQVKEISLKDYQPRGNTPLWDTMGIALRTLEKEVGEDAIALVTVITDGYENASREYTGKMIKDLVSRLDEKGWVFTYIGANQDAILEANKLGIRNSLNFDADEEGTQRMWMKEKASRSAFYCCASRSDVSNDELKSNYFDKGDFEDWN